MSSQKRSDGRRRREQILAAAEKLFAEQGYRATGIDEVGRAAGITGSGVYRHFSGKDELYNEVVERAVARRVAHLAEIVERATTPEQLLEALIGDLADIVLGHPATSSRLWQELRNLDVEGGTFFDRLHRLHVEEFVVPLRRLRPDLSVAQCRSLVDALYGLVISATEIDTGLSRKRLRELLTETGHRMLLG